MSGSDTVDTVRLESILQLLPLPEHPRRSLSAGCGAFREHDLLTAMWRGWLHIGIDIVRDAFRRHVQGIVQADAAALPFSCDFSLVLVRHPDLDKCPGQWEAILRNVSAFVVSGGVLLVTTYALHECDTAAGILRDLRRLELNENAFAPPDLTGHDRFVLAYTK